MVLSEINRQLVEQCTLQEAIDCCVLVLILPGIE